MKLVRPRRACSTHRPSHRLPSSLSGQPIFRERRQGVVPQGSAGRWARECAHDLPRRTHRHNSSCTALPSCVLDERKARDRSTREALLPLGTPPLHSLPRLGRDTCFIGDRSTIGVARTSHGLSAGAGKENYEGDIENSEIEYSKIISQRASKRSRGKKLVQSTRGDGRELEEGARLELASTSKAFVEPLQVPTVRVDRLYGVQVSVRRERH